VGQARRSGAVRWQYRFRSFQAMAGRTMTRPLTKYTAVIVRLDRTIQYAAAVVGISALVITGCPAFAGHDKKE
ncbi:hypothetical protein QUT48_22900, partial [Xanthomonas citri pv. citri]